MNKATRRWFASQLVRVTTTEGDAPAQNGSAERTIRWLKTRARTLLRAADFPPSLWACAMRAAAAQQRSEVLGIATKLAAPFGAKCLVRVKAYTSVAAAKGEIAERWISGRYAGLSPTVNEGHLVYRDDGKGNGFAQSLHVRTKVVEPPECPEQFEGESVPVRRRIVGKSPPEAELRAAQLGSWTWSELEAGAKTLLQEWDPEAAKNLLMQVCQAYPEEQYQAGMFRRGGIVGCMRSTWSKPWLASLCARLLQHHAPDATFTSVCLSNSCQKDIHIDSSNLPGTKNLILPVCLPKRGGDLWVELGSGDVVRGPIVEHTDARGRRRHGVVHRLEEDEVFEFDPKRHHFVTPFKGTRVVVIGYTSDVLGKAEKDDLDGLADLGFPLPDSAYLQAPRLSQVQEEEANEAPEIPIHQHPSFPESQPVNKGGGWQEVFPVADGFVDLAVNWSCSYRPVAPVCSPSKEEAGPEQEQRPVEIDEAWPVTVSWDMYVPQEPMSDAANASNCSLRMLRVVESGSRSSLEEEGFVSEGRPVIPYRLCKAEPTFTKNIEHLLSNLSSPLQIVHTVDPAEVALNPIPWIPSIEKEVKAIEHAVLRLRPSDPRQAEYLSDPRLQVVPSKFVFTVKPPDQGAAAVGDTGKLALTQPDVSTEALQGTPKASSQGQGLYRRKARLVACGNVAPNTGLDVYAGGAQAESLRTVIALASFFGWLLGVLDITSAFLKTPIPCLEGFPIFALTPPRLLVKLGLAVAHELWILSHAVYGLREAPRLWGQYRDACLAALAWDLDGVTYRLEPSTLDPNWWKVVRVEGGRVEGALLVYVDDFLLCGSLGVLQSLAKALQEKWATTPFVVATPEQPIKFLGVDIIVIPRGFVLSQQSYAEEVLRLHEVPCHVRGKIPCPRELASFEVGEGDSSPPDGEAVHRAQQVTGELLWLSQRTRPDLAFTASLLASLSTKAPCRALRIADRALAYLQRTKTASLVFEADGTQLHGWSDASFSPKGLRSHGGWCVCVHGCPVAWRSARQAFVTLSTAESELTASIECAIALESIEALLHTVGFDVAEERVLHVDSQASLGRVECLVVFASDPTCTKLKP